MITLIVGSNTLASLLEVSVKLWVPHFCFVGGVLKVVIVVVVFVVVVVVVVVVGATAEPWI